MSQKKILAIDIGGSKLLTGIVESDETGNASVSRKIRCDFKIGMGKEEIFAEVVRAAEESLGSLETDGIGVTIPGLADPQTGRWVYAPFSGIRDFPIGERLAEHFGKPVFAENDVNACAWAEHIFGVCRKINDFLWVTVSNGIGGGLVLGRKIFPGHFGCAAEIGHCRIKENGAKCGCGGRGCLEAEAAGPAISRRYAERIGKPVSLSAREIADLAKSGNAAAQETFNETGALLGKGLALAANLINPEAIVIGGGVAESFNLFAPSMEKSFRNDIMKFANKDVKIYKTGLGYEAGLFAAASLLYR